MCINLAAEAARQRRNVGALCGLLAHVDLFDICRWVVDADRVKGQLTSTYTDAEACARIRDLAANLDGGRVASERASDDTYTRVEAAGTFQDAPVSLWTHVNRTEGTARR